MRAFKKELTMLGVMIALAIVTAMFNPSFLGGDNLRNNVRHISLISLFALGEAMVIIAGGIDLSVGSIICIIVGGHQLPDDDAGVRHRHRGDVRDRPRASSIGVGRARVIARLGVPPFVVTLGSMLLLRGVAEVLTGGSSRLSGQVPRLSLPGRRIGFGLPMPFWFALGALGITAFLMHRTFFGRYCYAIGSNAEAARLSGVPVPRRPPRHVRGQRAPFGRRRHPLRRLPAGGDAGARRTLRAARRRGRRAGRLLAAGRSRHRVRRPHRRRRHAGDVQRRNLVGKSLWQNVVAGGVILLAAVVDRLFELHGATATFAVPRRAPAPAVTT